MTKYREILRLKSLGYSERNIALCCSVSRNTVAKVCSRAKELGIICLLHQIRPTRFFRKCYFRKKKLLQREGCQTMNGSARNSCAMVSRESFCGTNIAKRPEVSENFPLCIPSSAITCRKRIIFPALPCISHADRGNRLR